MPTPTRPDPDPYRYPPGRRPGPVRDPSRVIQWIGYHLGELVGIAGPAVLAVTVSWWFALATVLVTAGWITHEVRLHRHRQALTSAHRQAITTGRDNTTADATAESGEAERRATR